MEALRRGVVCACVAVLCAASLSGAVSVNIDASQTYQTMEGMGSMNRISQWSVRQGPFYVPHPLDNFYDSLINVMGFTFIRPAPDGCGFSPSAGQYSLSNIQSEYEHCLRLKQVADVSGEPFRVAPSVFSPPGYMKFNGQCPGGQESTYPSYTQNSLMPSSYAAYGTFCATYVSWVRDSLGLEVYAFSFQNEPFFNEPYASCSYADGSHYAEMLKVAGPIVRQAAPATRLYGVEHMTWSFPQWENAIRNDAQAAPYLDRYAVHGYTDGVQVDTSTFDTVTATGNKPVWMTETGGACETHDDGMVIARTIMRSFNKGVSAWMFCGCIGGASSCGWLVAKDHGTFPDGVPGPAYWAHAHFARFARPGWKRISASSGNSNVMVSAFADPASDGISIVLINTTTSTQSIDLGISGISAPTSFEGKMTTSSAGFADMGAVSPSSSISMPASSIVSLGYGHRGTGTAVRTAPVKRAAVVGAMPSTREYYDISGRRVVGPHAVHAGRAAPGCLVTVEGSRAVGRVSW